jgi:hypothetical protein
MDFPKESTISFLSGAFCLIELVQKFIKNSPFSYLENNITSLYFDKENKNNQHEIS